MQLPSVTKDVRDRRGLRTGTIVEFEITAAGRLWRAFRAAGGARLNDTSAGRQPVVT